MKATPFFALLLTMTPLVAENEAAKEETPKAAEPAAATPAAGGKELLPHQKAFLNIPEERRKEFFKNLSEASRLFGQKRVFETFEELDKAEKIFPESAEAMNMRGSCFVEIRAFDKALKQFEKAEALAKGNPSIEFNIAEVLFVTKQWQKSHDLFLKILKELPPTNISLSRLVEFKILLCKKKLGLKDEAVILAGKYDFLDDSPFYYFANATTAYDSNNLAKAEEWLAMANRIFRDPNTISPWQDTLVEYGYIKSFYGEPEVPAK